MLPTTIPDEVTRGNISLSSPTISSISGDHDLVFRSNIPRAGSDGRFGDEFAGQSVKDPVRNHPHASDFPEHFGLMFLNPEKPGGRCNRDPVPRDEVYSPLRRRSLQVRLASSFALESTLGQAQYSSSSLVVENHPLPHASCADGLDFRTIDTGFLDRVSNTETD